MWIPEQWTAFSVFAVLWDFNFTLRLFDRSVNLLQETEDRWDDLSPGDRKHFIKHYTPCILVLERRGLAPAAPFNSIVKACVWHYHVASVAPSDRLAGIWSHVRIDEGIVKDAEFALKCSYEWQAELELTPVSLGSEGTSAAHSLASSSDVSGRDGGHGSSSATTVAAASPPRSEGLSARHSVASSSDVSGRDSGDSDGSSSAAPARSGDAPAEGGGVEDVATGLEAANGAPPQPATSSCGPSFRPAERASASVRVKREPASDTDFAPLGAVNGAAQQRAAPERRGGQPDVQRRASKDDNGQSAARSGDGDSDGDGGGEQHRVLTTSRRRKRMHTGEPCAAATAAMDRAAVGVGAIKLVMHQVKQEVMCQVKQEVMNQVKQEAA